MVRKKNNFTVAIILVVFISVVIFGVVSHTYTSLTSNGSETTVEKEDDDNFLHTYMENIYDRLQNGTK